MTKYYPASLSAYSPGIRGHVVIKVEGDKVTTLGKLYVTEKACDDVVDDKNAKVEQKQAAK